MKERGVVMRKIYQILSILLIVVLLAGCSSVAQEQPPDQPYSINMAVLPGPSALGSLWLMDAAQNGDTINIYNIDILGTPEEVPPRIVQGTVDIAAVPTNMASILYNATDGDITVLALSTMGVLHVVDATEEITSIADLAGRTVHLSGMGAAPEFVFNYVLQQNGLIPGVDVELVFHAEMPQIAALLAQGAAEIALLPEPFATTVMMQNDNLRHALDLTKEWNLVSPDHGLVMTAIIARTEFLANYPAAVEIFMEEFGRSIEFVNSNVADAAQLAVDFALIPNVNIAAQAIPRSNQVFITGHQMQRYLSGYLAVLYAQLPAAIGGSLPDEDFYHIQ